MAAVVGEEERVAEEGSRAAEGAAMAGAADVPVSLGARATGTTSEGAKAAVEASWVKVAGVEAEVTAAVVVEEEKAAEETPSWPCPWTPPRITMPLCVSWPSRECGSSGAIAACAATRPRPSP